MRGFMEKDFGIMPILRSSENVVSFIMPDFLVRQPLTRKLQGPPYAVGGVIYVNIMLLTRNMNQGH